LSYGDAGHWRNSSGNKVEPFSWLCWAGLNREGKVDLIKGVWLNEPSFIPAAPSGKVR
jgi:hypothetical protein